MPITQLYCEGGSQGTDICVISQISSCLVRAVGSKYTLTAKVVADRRIDCNLAGLVDRDFDCVANTVNQQPISLFENAIQVGWSWERKEIENYLLDPVIVEKTCLSKKWFTLEEYQQALAKAAENLRFYTAARTALSCFGFKNRWGSGQTNVFSAKYTFPSDLAAQACRRKIEAIVDEEKGDRLVTSADVLQKFDTLLPEFASSGHRSAYPLVYHSGKDLLLAMKTSLDDWLPNPQKSIQIFTEHIVTQFERAENIWTWLPEWQQLHNLLENTL